MFSAGLPSSTVALVDILENLGYFLMQDILTSLGLAEGEPGLAVVRRPGNASSRWFVASPNRSAAISFQAEYVGAVLTASFLPAAPIQSIETEGEPIRIGRYLAGPGAFSRRDGVTFSPPHPHWERPQPFPAWINQEGKRKPSIL